MIVYGIPSMRLLKYIAVFTPEPWQGYGFEEESKEVLAQGRINGKDMHWGDTHHPALSETNGDYDGQYLFVNDKAQARVAVIDLRDWTGERGTNLLVTLIGESQRHRAVKFFCRIGSHIVDGTDKG